jgi:hypothetical protein
MVTAVGGRIELSSSDDASSTFVLTGRLRGALTVVAASSPRVES